MGAPMATPMAYRLTNNPADVNDVPRSFATVDNKPTITNSVVPMANALMVNAHNAAGRPFFLATVVSLCIVDVSIISDVILIVII
jgi:hypothetical protein